MSPNPLQDLDLDQAKVVQHVTGPAMVIAGAGSGKTRALTQRIAYLVQQGVDPRRILATTFTRKAAGEIRDRLKLFDVPCESTGHPGVRVGTLHSTAYEILRESSSFGAWQVSQSFQKLLVKELLVQLDVPEVIKVGDVLQFVSLAKNYGRRVDDGGVRFDSWFTPYADYADRYLDVYAAFEQVRTQRKLLTYDDMLLEAYDLLADPAVSARWGARFTHVLVDEAQDTNLVQFGIVEALIQAHLNYMIVGDPYQSIYSWRGAYPIYMRDFARRFPGAVTYTMGRNYRCARTILERAKCVIGNSIVSDFTPLELQAVRPQEGQADVCFPGTEQAQADWTVQQVGQLIAKGRRPQDIAILYRLKTVSKLLEAQLIQHLVSYCRLDGVPFFERATVRTLVGLLSLTVHPDWIEIACEALDALKFIGPATLDKLRTAPGDDVIARARWLGSKPRGVRIQQRQCDNLLQFASVIEACRSLPLLEAYDKLVCDLSFHERFRIERLDDDETDEDLHGDVAVLRRRLESFETVDELVDHANKLAGEYDDPEEKIGNRVVLSTIHRVKGLEFPCVFVLSAVEGVLPMARAVASNDVNQLDEERRLFYVAATRAKDMLVVCTPQTRTTWTKSGPTSTQCTPSRFVDEAQFDEIQVSPVLYPGRR